MFVVSAEQVCGHEYRCQGTASGVILQETSQLFVWDPLIELELHYVNRLLVSELQGSALSAYHLHFLKSHLPFRMGSEHEF